MTALLFGRPHLEPLWDNPRRNLLDAIWPTFCAFTGIVVIFGVLLGFTYSSFGSVPAALAYFRGERISVLPRLVNMGEGHPGESRNVSIEVANWTDKTIRVIGAPKDCACTVNDLPVTIPPRETRSISLELRLSGNPGIFTRKVGLLVDDQGLQRINFRLTGRILPDKDEPGAERSALSNFRG